MLIAIYKIAFMILPPAKNTNIVVQDLGRELLIYDLLTNKSYSLNETSKIVFNHCDGKTSFDQLKHRFKFTDELIYLALDDLKKENLLEENADYVSPFAGVSRRETIRRAGFVSLAILPSIFSLVAPTAAQTASCRANGQSCTPDNFGQGDCCSTASRCFNNTCVSCFGTGVVFAAAPTTGACTSYPERNLCCNTTGSPSGGNGAACVCP